MANNDYIKFSDMVRPDSSIEEAIKQMLELETVYASAIKKIKEEATTLRREIQAVSGATADNRKRISGAAQESDKLARAQKELAFAESENAKELARLKRATHEQNNMNKLAVRLNDSAEGSYDRLSAQYSINKIALNGMTAAQRAATEEGKALEAETKAIYDEMKRLQEATGKFSLDVGNYGKRASAFGDDLGGAAAEAAGLTSIVGNPIGFQIGKKVFDDISNSVKDYTNSQKAAKAAGDELKAAQQIQVKATEEVAKAKEEATQIGFKLTQGLATESEALRANEKLEETSAEAIKANTAEALASEKAHKANAAAITLGSVALRVLKQALIATGIGAFIVLVGSLISYLSRYQPVMDGVRTITAGASAAFTTLGRIVFDLIKPLGKIFTDPLQAGKDFVIFLKDNLIRQLQGVLDLTNSLRTGFAALFSGDMAALKKSASDAGTALIQMGTGMDATMQKNFANGVKDATTEIVNQYKAMEALERAKIAIYQSNRRLQAQIQDLMSAEEKQTAIADDQTRSFVEREKAADAAARLAQQRAGLEVKVARNNLSLINQEIGLRRKNKESVEDLLDQQLGAYTELRNAERGLTGAALENTKRQNELKQDRLERDLDILIDAFDNQKSINERIIKDEDKTFEVRRALLDETAKLFDESFKKQIDTIQQFTGVQVNENDLINESNAVVLNEKIRALGLSEIIEGRLLEIIRDRRTGVQDLSEAEKELLESKAKADKKALDDAEKAAEKAKREAKARYDAQVKDLDATREIADMEIDMLEVSERKKTDMKLKAERDRLKAIIALNKNGNKQLSDQEIKAHETAIKLIDKQMRDNMKKNIDIYDVFGLDLSDEKKEAIATSTQYALDALNTFLDAKIQAADRGVEASDKEVEASKRRLDFELEARANGYANNVLMAQKELDNAKKNQEKALKEQEKAQKAQQAIQTIQQIGNLVTASTMIWAQLGFPWAIPAIAAMFGSFVFAKVKAAQMAKQNAGTESYGEGTFEELHGGSHQSGNDIDLGSKPDGTRRRAEGGEGFAVFSKRAMRKFRSPIKDVVKSINNGTFGEKYLGAFRGDGLNVNIKGDGNNKEIAGMAKDVKEMNERGRRKFFQKGNDTIETYKNLTRIHKN